MTGLAKPPPLESSWTWKKTSDRVLVLAKPTSPLEHGPHEPDKGQTHRETDAGLGFDWSTWPIRAYIRIAPEGPEATLFFIGNGTSDTGPMQLDKDWDLLDHSLRYNFRYQGVLSYSPRPWYRAYNVQIILYEDGGRFPPSDDLIWMRGTGFSEYHNKFAGIVSNLRWLGEVMFPKFGENGITKKAALIQYDVDMQGDMWVNSFCVLMVQP